MARRAPFIGPRRLRLRKAAAALILAVCMTAACAEDGSATSVEVIVDMSGSFVDKAIEREDREALESIAAAVVTLAVEQWEQPVKLFWSTIGSSPAGRKPPCGRAREYRERIVCRQSSAEICKRRDLEEWMTACVLRLTGEGQPIDQHTDIAGAVQSAAERVQRHRGRKYVIVLSDFDEDLPPGRAPVPLKLAGEGIVMVYRHNPADVKNPSGLQKRVSDWTHKFRTAGARVCAIPVRGLLPRGVADCLERQ